MDGSPHPHNAVEGLKLNLVQSLTATYAAILKRQRAASSAFVRWNAGHRRAPEFAWLPPGREMLMLTGGVVMIDRSSPIFDVVIRMHDTIELNPYERELQYGFPYVIGHRRLSSERVGVPIRGPLLTIPACGRHPCRRSACR
jgi:hypothetical protein